MNEIKKQIKNQLKDHSPEIHEFLRHVKYHTYASHKTPQPPLKETSHSPHPIAKLPLSDILKITQPSTSPDDHLLA